MVADPSIGVADLVACLENFLDKLGHNHLHKQVEPPADTQVSWKSGVSPSWLCKMELLWKEYLAVASNGVIPAKKHRDSLLKVYEKRGLLLGKCRNPTDFVEKMDELIRIGLSHLREIRRCPVTRSRAWRKADAGEQKVLQEILEMLPDFERLVSNVDEDSQPQEDRSDQHLALQDDASSKPQVPVLEVVLDPSAVFKKVLQKPSKVESKSPLKAVATPVRTRERILGGLDPVWCAHWR